MRLCHALFGQGVDPNVAASQLKNKLWIWQRVRRNLLHVPAGRFRQNSFVARVRARTVYVYENGVRYILEIWTEISVRSDVRPAGDYESRRGLLQETKSRMLLWEINVYMSCMQGVV
jgi:hypothetical protein